MSGWKSIAGLALLMFAATAIVGCGGDSVEDKYEKVAAGMKLADVQKLLGEGMVQPEIGMAPAGGTMEIPGVTGIKPGAEVYVWRDGDIAIYVVFRKGKVRTKSRITQ
jgi:hypothetical protein